MRAILTAGVTWLAAVTVSPSCLADPKAGGRPGGPLTVGDRAPAIDAVHPAGNALGADDLSGKTVLVAFWQLDAKGTGMPVEPLRQVRRLAGDGLLLLTVCGNGSADDWDAWSRALLGQGTVDYGDGARRFIDDPKWWNVRGAASAGRASAGAYRVRADPAYFVIKPDGTLGGADVPAAELKATVQRLLK